MVINHMVMTIWPYMVMYGHTAINWPQAMTPTPVQLAQFLIVLTVKTITIETHRNTYSLIEWINLPTILSKL